MALCQPDGFDDPQLEHRPVKENSKAISGATRSSILKGGTVDIDDYGG